MAPQAVALSVPRKAADVRIHRKLRQGLVDRVRQLAIETLQVGDRPYREPRHPRLEPQPGNCPRISKTAPCAAGDHLKNMLLLRNNTGVD
jgi:hypothetical protein